MSMASRLTKLMILRTSWAGQEADGHLMSAVSGSRTRIAPQTGHRSGILYVLTPAGRFSFTTERIFGMISPLLNTFTVSPMPIPSLSMKS